MDDFMKIILKILIFTIAMILTSLLGGKLHAPRGIMVFVFLIYVLEIVRSICWGILYSFDVLGAQETVAVSLSAGTGATEVTSVASVVRRLVSFNSIVV